MQEYFKIMIIPWCYTEQEIENMRFLEDFWFIFKKWRYDFGNQRYYIESIYKELDLNDILYMTNAMKNFRIEIKNDWENNCIIIRD